VKAVQFIAACFVALVIAAAFMAITCALIEVSLA